MKKFIAFFLSFILLSMQTVFADQEQQKEVVIRLCEKITSENITTADDVAAELISDFSLKNGSKFKKGTKVRLMPKEVKKRGFAGRGGYIDIRRGLIKDINGKEYTLSLRQKVQGDDKDWVIACMTFFTISIFLIPLDVIGFVKGKSAIIDEGTTIDCMINY